MIDEEPMKVRTNRYQTQQIEIDLSFCRTAFYGALAMGLRPPGREMRRALRSRMGNAALADAASSVDAAAGTELLERVRRLRQVGEEEPDRLEQSYFRLFGHTARGEVPPYETEWGEDELFQKMHELADVGGFVRAFGLQSDELAHERIDHVACECELMMFLARKEGHALEHGDVEMLQTTRLAERAFLTDHLARFGIAFARRLAAADPDGFHGALGAVLEEVLRADCTRLDVVVGPAHLKLRDPAPDDTPMACGDCPLAGRSEEQRD